MGILPVGRASGSLNISSSDWIMDWYWLILKTWKEVNWCIFPQKLILRHNPQGHMVMISGRGAFGRWLDETMKAELPWLHQWPYQSKKIPKLVNLLCFTLWCLVPPWNSTECSHQHELSPRCGSLTLNFPESRTVRNKSVIRAENRPNHREIWKMCGKKSIVWRFGVSYKYLPEYKHSDWCAH